MSLRYALVGRTGSGRHTLRDMMTMMGIRPNDVTVVTPDELFDIERPKNTVTHVIYVTAPPDVLARRTNGADDEPEMDRFERSVMLQDDPMNAMPSHVSSLTVIENDADVETLSTEAHGLMRASVLHDRLCRLIEAYVAAHDEDGRTDTIPVRTTDDDVAEDMEIARYVEYLMHDEKAFYTVLQTVLSDPTLPETVL